MLKLELDTLRDFNITKIQNPQKLEEEAKNRLVRSLVPTTARGFMRYSFDGLFEDVYHHVIDCERLIVAKKDDEVAAYLAVTSRQLPTCLIYHIEGIIVEEKYRGTGLAAALVKSDVENENVIVFHTQSKLMLGLGQKLSTENLDFTKEVAKSINSKNPQGVVDVGRYKRGCLYDDIDKFAPLALPDINWMGGDARIYVGWLSQ